jgi:hypothetical protein
MRVWQCVACFRDEAASREKRVSIHMAGPACRANARMQIVSSIFRPIPGVPQGKPSVK